MHMSSRRFALWTLTIWTWAYCDWPMYVQIDIKTTEPWILPVYVKALLYSPRDLGNWEKCGHLRRIVSWWRGDHQILDWLSVWELWYCHLTRVETKTRCVWERGSEKDKAFLWKFTDGKVDRVVSYIFIFNNASWSKWFLFFQYVRHHR